MIVIVVREYTDPAENANLTFDDVAATTPFFQYPKRRLQSILHNHIDLQSGTREVGTSDIFLTFCKVRLGHCAVSCFIFSLRFRDRFAKNTPRRRIEIRNV